MSNRENWTIGLDVGGTGIKAALVSNSGQMAHWQNIPICPEKEPAALLDQLIGLINFYMNNSGVSAFVGVGLALPGAVNDSAGTAVYCPNLGWRNVSLSAHLTERTGCKVRLVNDANAAALGEYFYGEQKGSPNILCLTLGTGLGSGLILERRLFTGLGSGVEAGHMIIDRNGLSCACGARGCWETYVSASALVRRANERLLEGIPSLLRDVLIKDGRGLSSEIIFTAYNHGDKLACELVGELKDYLALGLGNLVNLFQPEQIILAGGMTQAGKPLLEGLAEMTRMYVYPPFRDSFGLYLSKLGSRAGVLGAASLWLQESLIA